MPSTNVKKTINSSAAGSKDNRLPKSPPGSSKKASATTTTPLRNNYAAPHTPIASVKRPRSSMLSPGAGSSKPGIPTTPLVPPANLDSTATPKTPATAGRRDSDAAANLSPLHPPRPLVIREDEPANFNLNLLEEEKPAQEGEDSSSWVGRQVDALFSPVLNFLSGEKEGEEGEDHEDHPHPTLQRRTHKDDVHLDNDLPNEQQEAHERITHADTSSKAEAPSKDGVKESENKPEDDDEIAAVTDEDVTMEDAASKQLQPSDTSQTTQATSHDEHEDEDEEDAQQEAEHEGHDEDGEREGHEHEHGEEEEHLVGDDDASSQGTLEEDEFNPYVFIKSLPAYDLVAPLRPPIALPAKRNDSPPLSLVLDLDETLVHCTVEPVDDADLIFPVVFHGMTYQVHVRLRPHLFTFLEKIKGKFEVIVFTASQKVYANELLNLIDPDGKYIQYRMFRESCLAVEGNFLKDLNVLGRDLSKAVLVDNSPHAFGYQMDNGIPIESWFDDPHDTELLKLERFLRTLHNSSDVRPLVRRKFETFRLVAEA